VPPGGAPAPPERVASEATPADAGPTPTSRRYRFMAPHEGRARGNIYLVSRAGISFLRDEQSQGLAEVWAGISAACHGREPQRETKWNGALQNRDPGFLK
jgi:hypothetical protein